MKEKEGFTLLELIMALSISAVIGVWAVSFFISQLVVYRKQIQLSQAESLGDMAAFKMTSKLEQAVSFRTDPRKEDALYYLEGGEWDSIGAEDMEPLTDGDYEIKLDFSDTEPEMAAAWIIILYKGEEIHSRKIELPALWDSGKEKQGDMTDEKDLKQER